MENSRFNTFNVAMTAKQAATYMRSLCGKEGVDVLEHLIQVIGSNKESLLGHMFQTLDPAFESQFPQVGASLMKANSGYQAKGGKRPFSKLVITEVNPMSLTRSLHISYYALNQDGTVQESRYHNSYKSLKEWNMLVAENSTAPEKVQNCVRVEEQIF